jgi:hypothetical protein
VAEKRLSICVVIKSLGFTNYPVPESRQPKNQAMFKLDTRREIMQIIPNLELWQANKI